jgi:hypothetical protein
VEGKVTYLVIPYVIFQIILVWSFLYGLHRIANNNIYGGVVIILSTLAAIVILSTIYLGVHS